MKTCICDAWSRNLPKLNSAVDFVWIHGGDIHVETFIYCPYCGRVLINKNNESEEK